MTARAYSEATVRSKSLLGARNDCSSVLGSHCALEIIAQTMLLSHRGAQSTCSSMLLCHRGAQSACSSKLLCHCGIQEGLQRCVQRICSKKLGSATLHFASLHSAPLYSVHGYARVHTSIYIYIYQYIYIYIHIYIYIPNIFHMFSLVCFLTYGVNRRQVLTAKPHLYFPDCLPLLCL